MSESTYTINGTRVKGEGWSYNLTNQKDAIKLCETLNHYQKTHQLNTQIEKQYDTITKQLIQIKLSIGTLTEEVQRLEKEIQCLSK